MAINVGKSLTAVAVGGVGVVLKKLDTDAARVETSKKMETWGTVGIPIVGGLLQMVGPARYAGLGETLMTAGLPKLTELVAEQVMEATKGPVAPVAKARVVSRSYQPEFESVSPHAF